jgi:hypothetical protein
MSLNFNTQFNTFQRDVYNKFKKFEYPKVKVENNCDKISKKFELSYTQQFISAYFTPENPNGMLLYHTVGAGKTNSGVNLLQHFEKQGYLCLWITRTTLRKDLQKALDVIPLKSALPVFSYKQFSNICKKKGENYRKLIQRINKKFKVSVENPLYKTIVIIDEAHHAYSKDLKAQEMHDILAIQKCIFESYTQSAKTQCKVILMSATPITEDPIEVVKLFNLIISDKNKRFDIETFKSVYLNENGNFIDNKKVEFKEKIKGLVSYINTSKDPSKFAQVEYIKVLVPISDKVKDLTTDIKYCTNEYAECKKLGLSIKECKKVKTKCSARVKSDKEISKRIGKKDQYSLLKSKCNIQL